MNATARAGEEYTYQVVAFDADQVRSAAAATSPAAAVDPEPITADSIPLTSSRRFKTDIVPHEHAWPRSNVGWVS